MVVKASISSFTFMVPISAAKAEPVRPSTVCKQINDEVETIVLKCLDKERERRYQTAGELGRDVMHYLAGEPIEAKRDSTTYLLRKHLRKHRVAVGVAAAFVLVVLGSGISLAIQTARAKHEAESVKASQAFLVDMLASVDPLQRRRIKLAKTTRS